MTSLSPFGSGLCQPSPLPAALPLPPSPLTPPPAPPPPPPPPPPATPKPGRPSSCCGGALALLPMAAAPSAKLFKLLFTLLPPARAAPIIPGVGLPGLLPPPPMTPLRVGMCEEAEAGPSLERRSRVAGGRPVWVLGPGGGWGVLLLLLLLPPPPPPPPPFLEDLKRKDMVAVLSQCCRSRGPLPWAGVGRSGRALCVARARACTGLQASVLICLRRGIDSYRIGSRVVPCGVVWCRVAIYTMSTL